VNQREIAALGATGHDRKLLTAANTLFDMSNMGYRPLFGCSSFLVPASHSKTGGSLFARNLDFFDLGYLHQYSLVMVHAPTDGKFGFAHIGFPGAMGCYSGMNEHGLAMARHEVVSPKKMQGFSLQGMPFMFSLRSVLEMARNVAEAVQVLQGFRNTTLSIIGLADKDRVAVVELSPAGTFERESVNGIACMANHYQTSSLNNPAQVNTHRTLDREKALLDHANAHKADVKEAWAAISSTEQGEMTVQSMVFEPGAKTIHLALGKGPTTQYTPTPLAIEQFFTK
jgi:isopenicillin-N N-acyltransferase like protein